MKFYPFLLCHNKHSGMEVHEDGKMMFCRHCSSTYHIVDGVPILFDFENASAIDKDQVKFYERIYQNKVSAESHNRGLTLQTEGNKLWRQAAALYAQSNSERESFSLFESLFQFKGGERVLEIGCGNGTIGTFECLKYKDNIEYVGFDFSLNPLIYLKKQFQNNQADNFLFVNANAIDDNFAPESFDIIFGKAVLHHFDKNTKPILADKIYSLLKPNGKAFFLEPLNTDPIMVTLRKISSYVRPNLAWEHPFTYDELTGFLSNFDKHQIYYFDFISVLSMLFVFNKKLFNIMSKYLREADKRITKNPLFHRLFIRAVFLVYKNNKDRNI